MYVECVIISDKRTARQKREVMYSLLFVDTWCQTTTNNLGQRRGKFTKVRDKGINQMQ